MEITQKGTAHLIENLALSAGSRYTHSGKPDRAKTYLNLLKNKYPESQYVKDGTVDRYLKGLAIKIGNTAPEFSVTTMNGESFSLSGCKGKFVMIDFWGTWCGPCRGEVPNFKKLYTTIPRDSLLVIGLAEDDSTTLAPFIAEQAIPYPNALATKELLDAYGVNRFPTTFLIGPDGTIIAKDLRGESVVEQVREKMKESHSGAKGIES